MSELQGQLSISHSECEDKSEGYGEHEGGNEVMLNFISTPDATVDFTCEHCHIKFNKRSHVYRHIRQKHEQSRNYPCPYQDCLKTFKRGSHLKRHLISHTHQKKFKCLQCVMEFGYKHHLERHIKIVHEKRLYGCQLCAEEFTKKKGLARHIREAHGQGLGLSEEVGKKKRIRKERKIGKEGGKEEQNEEQEQVYQESQSDSGKGQNKPQTQPKLFPQPRLQCPPPNQQTIGQPKTLLDILKPSKSQGPKQIILYRCGQPGCFKAYRERYRLKNHVNKVHNV